MKRTMRTGVHLDAVGKNHIGFFSTDYRKHGNEASDGFHIIEGKVHVNNFYWFKLGFSNSCTLRKSFIFAV